MATEFIAFVRKSKMPPASELARAMSSRGWLVEIDSEAALDEIGGSFPLKIDGNPVPLTLSVGPVGDDALEGVNADEVDARLVRKNTDLRFAFSAEDDANGKWARDTARALGLLACGAFANGSTGNLVNYAK